MQNLPPDFRDKQKFTKSLLQNPLFMGFVAVVKNVIVCLRYKFVRIYI